MSDSGFAVAKVVDQLCHPDAALSRRANLTCVPKPNELPALTFIGAFVGAQAFDHIAANAVRPGTNIYNLWI